MPSLPLSYSSFSLPIPYSLKLGNRLLDLSTPRVMGILNLTPDSFFDASRVHHRDQLLKTAEKMIEEGVDILDVGGHSTRPGAPIVSEEEELDRVLPAIETLHNAFAGTPVSIDTFRSTVARLSIEAGAQLVNDVSGGMADDQMFTTVAELKVPYILMHIRSGVSQMHQPSTYENIALEVTLELQYRIRAARQAGIADIIADPGFGFSKRAEQNFALLARMDTLQILDVPILAGLSRKSMVYQTLQTNASEALNGTTALHMASLIKGASILRVHDVKEARETIELFTRLCLPE